jgi:hypothetical protein
MRLFEFTDSGSNDEMVDDSANTLAVEITAIVGQLLSRMKDTATNEPYSLRALLNKLGEAGIPITPEQFREMVKSEPLSNLIANVKDDDVIFIDQDEYSDAFDPDTSTKTLKSMAKKAQKNRD